MHRERFPGRAPGRHDSTDSLDLRHQLAPGKRTLTEGLMVERREVTATPGAEIAAEGRPGPSDARPAAADGGTPRPTLQMLFGVQRTAAAAAEDAAQVHAAAARGTATAAAQLPYADQIQRAFGRHDISPIKAHVGADAAAAAHEMGARAYATGDHVVLGPGADLHTVAHEAAHVVQQRRGVQLKEGVGEVGDACERHADEVASVVAQGGSAEPALDRFIGSSPLTATPGAVQRMKKSEKRTIARDDNNNNKKNKENDSKENPMDNSTGGSTVLLPGRSRLHKLKSAETLDEDELDVELESLQGNPGKENESALSGEQAQIADSLKTIERSKNGISGVFLAGRYAIKADDRETFHAIELGEALGLPMPTPVLFVEKGERLAELIRDSIRKLEPNQSDTGFTVMRKVEGKDFADLDLKNLAWEKLDVPKLRSDIAKLWAFLQLTGSTDDFTTDNKSNLLLETGSTPAIIGIDIQLDDQVRPEETKEWIQGLAGELKEQELKDSKIADIQRLLEQDLGMPASDKESTLPLLLDSIVSVLEAALRAADDQDIRKRVGPVGVKVLDAIKQCDGQITVIKSKSAPRKI